MAARNDRAPDIFCKDYMDAVGTVGGEYCLHRRFAWGGHQLPHLLLNGNLGGGLFATLFLNYFFCLIVESHAIPLYDKAEKGSKKVARIC